MLGIVIGISLAIVAVLLILKKMGVFDEVKIDHNVSPSFTFYYKNITQDYHTLIPVYQKIRQQIQSFKALLELNNRNLACVASLFYDNPRQVLDRKSCRASVGIAIFQECISNDIKIYMATIGYKEKLIPSSQAIYSSYKYITDASVALGAMKIYRPLMTFAFSENETKESLVKNGVICMELYRSSAIQYWLPYKNVKEFFLTIEPAPLTIHHHKVD
jgi:hypothetical protein